MTKPGSNVTTQMRVWDINEEEARENVALNGWQIISIEESEPGEIYRSKRRDEANEFTVTITKVGEGDVEPFGDVTVENGGKVEIKMTPAPCEKLGKLLVNGREVNAGSEYLLRDVSQNSSVVAIFMQNGSGCSDNGIFNKNLKEISKTYFELGKFDTKPLESFITEIESLNKNKKYVLIGFTDDVAVQPNSRYKDNFQLSKKRAEFIKGLLTKAGFAADNIKTIGLGPAFPDAKNSKKGQIKNRRVVVYEQR